MIHPRGYTDFYDNWSFQFHAINFALVNSKNMDDMIFTYKKWADKMTDFQIAYGFRYIGKQ